MGNSLLPHKPVFPYYQRTKRKHNETGSGGTSGEEAPPPPLLAGGSLTKEELLASKYSINQIKEFIGVDSIKFISLDGVYRALGYHVGRDEKDPKFTDHYFSGDYPVELIDQKSGTIPSQLSLLIETK